MCRRPCLHAPKPEQKQMRSHGPHARKSLARLQHQPHVRILAPSLAPALCGDRGASFRCCQRSIIFGLRSQGPVAGYSTRHTAAAACRKALHVPTRGPANPLPAAAARALPPPQAHAPAAASPDASGDSSSQCFVSPAHGLDCAKTTAPAALAADPLRLPVVRRACGQIAGRSRRQAGPGDGGCLPQKQAGRAPLSPIANRDTWAACAFSQAEGKNEILVEKHGRPTWVFRASRAVPCCASALLCVRAFVPPRAQGRRWGSLLLVRVFGVHPRLWWRPFWKIKKPERQAYSKSIKMVPVLPRLCCKNRSLASHLVLPLDRRSHSYGEFFGTAYLPLRR